MLYQKVADATNGQLFKPTLGKRILYGNSGPDIIFDCVASESTLDDALHLVRSNGKIVILGLGYSKTKKIDWALQSYKELEIRGTMMDGLETYQGKKFNAFELAIKFIKENSAIFEGLVTHKFSIEDYKAAFRCASKKERNKAIKVVFDFS